MDAMSFMIRFTTDSVVNPPPTSLVTILAVVLYVLPAGTTDVDIARLTGNAVNEIPDNQGAPVDFAAATNPDWLFPGPLYPRISSVLTGHVCNYVIKPSITEDAPCELAWNSGVEPRAKDLILYPGDQIRFAARYSNENAHFYEGFHFTGLFNWDVHVVGDVE